MSQRSKNPAPLSAGRAPESFCLAAERSENCGAPLHLQSTRFASWFGFAPLIPRLIEFGRAP